MIIKYCKRASNHMIYGIGSDNERFIVVVFVVVWLALLGRVGGGGGGEVSFGLGLFCVGFLLLFFCLCLCFFLYVCFVLFFNYAF